MPRPSRRPHLVDAAIRAVAQVGLRGLTHRAVDAAAGVPTGTTSNYFGTREELVDAIAARLEERDLEILAALGPVDGCLAQLLDSLAAMVVHLATEERDLLRARLTLFLDAPDRFRPGHRRLLGQLTDALEHQGIPDAPLRARVLSDYLDGYLFHEATVRRDTPGGTEVADSLRRLLGPTGPRQDSEAVPPGRSA